MLVVPCPVVAWNFDACVCGCFGLHGGSPLRSLRARQASLMSRNGALSQIDAHPVMMLMIRRVFISRLQAARKVRSRQIGLLGPLYKLLAGGLLVARSARFHRIFRFLVSMVVFVVLTVSLLLSFLIPSSCAPGMEVLSGWDLKPARGSESTFVIGLL